MGLYPQMPLLQGLRAIKCEMLHAHTGLHPDKCGTFLVRKST